MFETLPNPKYPIGGVEAIPIKPPTVLEKLLSRRVNLSFQMAEVDEAIQILESHPELEKVLTLLGRVL